jgi:hypothetical protein
MNESSRHLNIILKLDDVFAEYVLSSSMTL